MTSVFYECTYVKHEASLSIWIMWMFVYDKIIENIITNNFLMINWNELKITWILFRHNLFIIKLVLKQNCLFKTLLWPINVSIILECLYFATDNDSEECELLLINTGIDIIKPYEETCITYKEKNIYNFKCNLQKINAWTKIIISFLMLQFFRTSLL